MTTRLADRDTPELERRRDRREPLIFVAAPLMAGLAVVIKLVGDAHLIALYVPTLAAGCLVVALWAWAFVTCLRMNTEISRRRYQ